MAKFPKSKWIKALKVIAIFLFAGLFIFITIYANKQRQEVICNEIVINIKDNEEQQFINENEVREYINNYGQSIVINQPIHSIDKASIEKRIEENAFVANAEVFSNFEGNIKVNVSQKKPIYRVFNNKGVSYYVSNNSEIIPLSSKFTPRLIVVTGYLPNAAEFSQSEKSNELKILVEFISNNSFWSAFVGQIYVAKNGDYILYPKIDEHRIILGDINGLATKFKQLEAFYQDGLKYMDWKKYTSVSVKYKGQIICTKK